MLRLTVDAAMERPSLVGGGIRDYLRAGPRRVLATLREAAASRSTTSWPPSRLPGPHRARQPGRPHDRPLGRRACGAAPAGRRGSRSSRARPTRSGTRRPVAVAGAIEAFLATL